MCDMGAYVWWECVCVYVGECGGMCEVCLACGICGCVGVDVEAMSGVCVCGVGVCEGVCWHGVGWGLEGWE